MEKKSGKKKSSTKATKTIKAEKEVEVVEEVKGYGCTIVDAIEIGSYRDVLIRE